MFSKSLDRVSTDKRTLVITAGPQTTLHMGCDVRSTCSSGYSSSAQVVDTTQSTILAPLQVKLATINTSHQQRWPPSIEAGQPNGVTEASAGSGVKLLTAAKASLQPLSSHDSGSTSANSAPDRYAQLLARDDVLPTRQLH